jgi:hypothetical protein
MKSVSIGIIYFSNAEKRGGFRTRVAEFWRFVFSLRSFLDYYKAFSVAAVAITQQLD